MQRHHPGLYPTLFASQKCNPIGHDIVRLAQEKMKQRKESGRKEEEGKLVYVSPENPSR